MSIMKKMQMKPLALGVALGASLCSLAMTAAASDKQQAEEAELSKFYAGFGLGLTKLEPDTNDTPYEVEDDSSEGGKIYIGYDLTPKLSLEAYYSILGEADISPEGSIDYEDMGANLNYFFYGAENGQPGLSLFVRAGLGKMNNDTDLRYKRDNDMHLMFGAGLQYGLGGGWALRADVDLYDGDSKLLALGINKHFGSKSRKQTARPVQSEPVLAVAAQPEPARDLDSDQDGVVDSLDKCPTTTAAAPVDRDGCELPDTISLEGVRFASNSDQLIGESTDILDSVADRLSAYPALRIEVAGHTDSQGSAAYNQQLSEKRAEAVRQYLISRGIDASLLSAAGYGESRPAADNNSPEGRAANRRVELQLQDRVND